MFAGNTAMRSRISPQLAILCRLGKINIVLSRISATPLTSTSVACHGRYGGTFESFGIVLGLLGSLGLFVICAF
jgi:hypothetical protein